MVFNFSSMNAITHESFARFTIDHRTIGLVFKSVLKVILIAFAVLCIVARAPGVYEFHYLFDSIDRTYTRDQDWDYIRGWYLEHLPNINSNLTDNTDLNRILTSTEQREQAIKEGTAFFKEHLLAPGQLENQTRDLVLEADADVTHFILTRVVYLYVFGCMRNKPLPCFFQEKPCSEIAKLSSQYENRQQEGAALDALMKDHEAYNRSENPILNCLKQASYYEMRGSLFLQDCWLNARREAVT